MDDIALNDLEMASKSVVMQAARHFAQALADTPQYQEFEGAFLNYRQDANAQQAIQNFQQKQASLKAIMQTNAVNAEDKQELQQLQEQFFQQPSVIRYGKAQEALAAVSQEVGDLLSKAIELDFGNSCRTGGCCG
jgi:cell fate (sporulation/competence/biofilm development) regulator YlbF (YheA/YmcA/DUF963 family)